MEEAEGYIYRKEFVVYHLWEPYYYRKFNKESDTAHISTQVDRLILLGGGHIRSKATVPRTI